MSADPSLASSTTSAPARAMRIPAAGASDIAEQDPALGQRNDDVEGLVHAMRKLRAAVRNLTALQRGHEEMARRLRELEETSTRRAEGLTTLRRQLVERDAHVAFLQLEIERRGGLTAPRTDLARAREQEETAADAAAHLVFLAAAGGYVVEERTGPPPPQGATVEVSGARYTVTKQGASPLPHDDRRCAYLL